MVFFGLAMVALAAQPKPAWQQEWEKTLEAAKKEGQVVVYISGYEAMLPDFEKEFPEIKLVAVPARGTQIVQRLTSERRGEKYLADVVSTGSESQLPAALSSQSTGSDQSGADSSGDYRPVEMV